MEKVVFGLEPSKPYKIRYRAVYQDGRESAPSIAYSIVTPSAPTPPEVDQTTITVDSQSFKDGIIISWDIPEEDLSKPPINDYLIQITDDIENWSKYENTTTENKTIFSEQDQLVSFGTLVPIIYIRVITRSINKLFSIPESYKEYEFAAETGLRPPDVVTGVGLLYSWRVSWSYIPSRPDIVAGYNIYDDDTLVTTITDETENSYVNPIDLTIAGMVKTVGVSALDADGNESAIRYAAPFIVDEITIDVDPPDVVTNASAQFDGTTYILTFDRPSDSDLKDFIISLVGTNAFGSTTRLAYLPVSGTTQQTFQLNLDENKAFFGSAKSTIVASIQARDLAGNIGTAVSNISASMTIDISAPTNVVLTPGLFSYTATWDIPTSSAYEYSKIYESSTQNGTYTHVISGITPIIRLTNNSDSRWVKVTHVAFEGTESPFSNSIEVTPINPITVDTTAPDQRTNISYTAVTEGISVSWTNPSGGNNTDIAGITIRYAKASDPNNYVWEDVPFSSTSLITSVTIANLLPNTLYTFSISTYDKVQNRTAYSTSTSITTLSDNSPPPRPVAPLVSAGSTATGPMTVRIIQDSIQYGTSNPLPLDTSYFRVYMLDSGFSSAPSTGVSTNNNASQVGIIDAGFNGSSNQGLFFIPLENGEQRYFYTRAVDTSENISDASPAVQSSAMTVFSDAYITNLSADKILAGTLQASRYIKVGTTSNQITIISETGGTGKIFSGTGTYSNSNTGFYLDSDGQFSLKDRLTWNPTGADPITGLSTGLLTVRGSIEAQSGSFTGNVRLNGGSLYAGALPNSGTRVIINSSGITGYNETTNTFTLSSAGVNAIAGAIGGWTIGSSSLSSGEVSIDSSNKRITLGPSAYQFLIGFDAGGNGTNKHGIKLANSDYIYGDGTFRLGAGAVSWNGSALSVTGSGTFDGTINASGGTFTGNVKVLGGSLYVGTAPSGTNNTTINNSSVVINQNGIAAKNSSGATTFALLTDGSAAFSGDVTATTFIGQNIELKQGAVDFTYLNNTGTSTTVAYTVKSFDGADFMLKAPSSGANPAKIRWIDSANYVRGTLGWELGADPAEGGSSYPETMVLRAASTLVAPGKLLLNAMNSGLGTSYGEITLKAQNLFATGVYDNLLSSSARIVAINSNGRLGYATGSNLSVQAGYINATDNQNQANRITYSTTSASTYYSAQGLTPREGDVHLRYV